MKNKLILFYSLLGIVSSWAMQSEFQPLQEELKEQAEYIPPTAFATHGMLIFLDEKESDYGAASTELLIALHQKACPILCSATLLAHVLSQPLLKQLGQLSSAYKPILDYITKLQNRVEMLVTQHGTNYQEQQQIVDRLNKEFLSKPPYVTDTLENTITQLQSDERISKKIDKKIKEIIKNYPPREFRNQKLAALNQIISTQVNDSLMRTYIATTHLYDFITKMTADGKLLLLIPKSYKPHNTNISLENYVAPAEKPNVHALTQTELELGLKIDHLDDWNGLDQATSADMNYFMQALYNQKGISEIFVTNQEYAQQKTQLPIPQWAIYMAGHGSVKQKIAGLALQQFMRFLDFLEKIKTKIFVYTTCFAAGTNVEIAFKNQTKVVGATYTYPIVFQGFIQATASGGTLLYKLQGPFTKNDIDFEKKTIQFTSENKNFKQFIEMATDPWKDAISNTYAPLLKPVMHNFDPGYKASIRLPGLEWFNIIDFDQDIYAITPIIAKTRTAPFSLLQVAQQKKMQEIKYILLYSPVVPFELKIDAYSGRSLPRIVSMTPLDSASSIYKISSTMNGLDELFDIFNYTPKHRTRQIFWISEIQAATPIKLPLGQKISHVTDVIIDYDKDTYKVYFTNDNTQYAYNTFDKTIIEYSYKEEYKDVIDYALAGTQEKFEKQQELTKKLEKIHLKKSQEAKQKAGAQRKSKIKSGQTRQLNP